jgi:hypothetical protein
MTLASWTGVEAGVKRQLVTAVGHQEKLGVVLTALDGRIANLQAALASAVKAAESLPSQKTRHSWRNQRPQHLPSRPHHCLPGKLLRAPPH